MLVFIDESGDPGFKVARGSTPVFVVAMVIFDNSESAQQTEAVIRGVAERLKLRSEFKFNKTADNIRQSFFEAVRGCPFVVRAVVVRKAAIRSSQPENQQG